jgi:hypothetical protein
MTGVGWQDLLVAAVAVAAVMYLVRRRRPKPVKSELVTLGRGPKRDAGAGSHG